MKEAKLIVAVTNVCANDVIVAAGVVYDVTAQGPVFTFVDGRGQPQKATFADYSKLTSHYQNAVVNHIKRTAHAYAAIQTKDRDVDREDFMGLAVARALERLHHTRADVLKGVDRENVRILVPGTTLLLTRYTGGAPQILVPEKAKADWRLLAALAVARHRAADPH